MVKLHGVGLERVGQLSLLTLSIVHFLYKQKTNHGSKCKCFIPTMGLQA